jgi:hypothetical protein
LANIWQAVALRVLRGLLITRIKKKKKERKLGNAWKFVSFLHILRLLLSVLRLKINGRDLQRLTAAESRDSRSADATRPMPSPNVADRALFGAVYLHHPRRNEEEEEREVREGTKLSENFKTNEAMKHWPTALVVPGVVQAHVPAAISGVSHGMQRKALPGSTRYPSAHAIHSTVASSAPLTARCTWANPCSPVGKVRN